jgi:hypothetical protein
VKHETWQSALVCRAGGVGESAGVDLRGRESDHLLSDEVISDQYSLVGIIAHFNYDFCHG